MVVARIYVRGSVLNAEVAALVFTETDRSSTAIRRRRGAWYFS